MHHPLQPGAIILSVSVEELSRLIRTGINDALDERLPKGETEKPEGATDFLTRAETAQLLHVSLSTLRKLEKSGALIPCRVGRRLLYRTSDLTEALQQTQGRRRHR